jgi:hypothetical protein
MPTVIGQTGAQVRIAELEGIPTLDTYWDIRALGPCRTCGGRAWHAVKEPWLQLDGERKRTAIAGRFIHSLRCAKCLPIDQGKYQERLATVEMFSREEVEKMLLAARPIVG